MNKHLTTTALATLLVPGGSSLATVRGQQGAGQSSAQPQAVAQEQTQLAWQLQHAEQQPNLQSVRQAVTQAQNAVQGQQPSQQQASTQVREAADALAELHRGRGNENNAAALPGTTGMPLARVQNLVGTTVTGADGKDADEIQNLLIDGSGEVRAAVVGWGGFLGMGERSAVMQVERIQLGAAAGENNRAQLKMTKNELDMLPGYDDSRAGEYGREQSWGNGLRLYY